MGIVENSAGTYLILDAASGLIKIGRTGRFGRRLASLFNANPHIVPLALFRGEENELRLHAAFKEKRISGEWFRLSFADVVKAFWICNGGCPLRWAEYWKPIIEEAGTDLDYWEEVLRGTSVVEMLRSMEGRVVADLATR